MKKIFLPLFSFFSLQTNTYADFIENSGDYLQILIPVAAFGTTLYLDDQQGQTQFYKSFGSNIAFTHGLKYAIDRRRPNGGDRSFPSGHTSAAFQGASFLHKGYGFEYALPAYLGAAFVGYSRVYADAHYASDVVAGAIIGTLSSFYFTTEYKGVAIKPQAMHSGYGVQLNRSF